MEKKIQKPEIYISYKWKGEKQPEIVKLLYNRFIGKGYNIKIDFIDIVMDQDSQKKKKINEFMQDLGNSKYIVAVINDQYLKSKYCMYEILETLKYPDVHDRIFPIILEDANIEDSESLKDYIVYWENATKELIDIEDKSKQQNKEDIVLFNDIRKVISKFTSEIQFMNVFKASEHRKNNFEDLFKAIDEKIKKDEDQLSADYQDFPEHEIIHDKIKRYAKKLNHIPFYDHKQLIGRQDLLSKLHSKLLTQNDPLILANGIGGIGKTTLALAYINNATYTQHFQHIVWINTLNSIQDAMLQDLDTDLIDFTYDPDLDPKSNFDELINTLSQIKGHNLLVLDNANDIRDLDNLKGELKKINWKILVTSRVKPKGYTIMQVDNLPPEQAKELFYRYYKKEVNDKLVDSLLEKIEYHTLLTELLAKSANANPDLNLKRLHDIIAERKIDASELQKGIWVEHKLDAESQLRQQQIYEYIVGMFNFTNLSNNDNKYLRYFSILPSRLEDVSDLIHFFQIKKEDKNNFITTLNDLAFKGWLIKEKDSYKAHPLIQTVVRERLKADANNCKVLLQVFSKKFLVEVGKNPLKKRGILPFGDSILGCIDNDDKDLATLLDNYAKTLRYFGDYDKAIKYALKAIEIREKVLDEKHPDLGDSYVNTSVIYRYKGELEESLKYGLKSLKFHESLPEKDYVKLATSYYKLTLTYLKLGNLQEALEYSHKDLAALKKGLEEDHPYFAETYNTRGEIFRLMGDLEKSLKCKLEALRIREVKIEDDHPDLAISYHHTSLTYYELKDYQKAKHYIDKAVAIRKEILPEEHPDLKDSLDWQEKIYQKLNSSRIQ